MTRARRRNGPDPDFDPHGVAKAQAGTVTCNCGERFIGRSTGESWDMYYSHWAFWGNSVQWPALKSKVQ